MEGEVFHQRKDSPSWDRSGSMLSLLGFAEFRRLMLHLFLFWYDVGRKIYKGCLVEILARWLCLSISR